MYKYSSVYISHNIEPFSWNNNDRLGIEISSIVCAAEWETAQRRKAQSNTVLHFYEMDSTSTDIAIDDSDKDDVNDDNFVVDDDHDNVDDD